MPERTLDDWQAECERLTLAAERAYGRVYRADGRLQRAEQRGFPIATATARAERKEYKADWEELLRQLDEAIRRRDALIGKEGLWRGDSPF